VSNLPRGFNDTQKELIRAQLIDKGKVLFANLGLKKTSIEDLTKAVGIAQGSFYNFFSSKEELYFEILELEEALIKSSLIEDSNCLKGTPQEILKAFLTSLFELVENNVFMKRMHMENEMEILIRKLPSEKFINHKKNDFIDFLPLIENWIKDGIIVDKSPEIISGLIRSVLTISFHKNQLGVETYNQSIKLLIDMLSESLTRKEL
jgi:AcrR family transcriptional regulator